MTDNTGELGGKKVLVTPRALTKNPERVSRLLADHGFVPVLAVAGLQPSSEELKELLRGCVGWIAGVEQVDADVLAGAPYLRVLSRFGTGTSNVDLSAARLNGVEVRSAAGANAQSVAELAVGLTLDCLRGISMASSVVRSGGWQRQLGHELSGLKILVVGYGAIGKLYAQLMQSLGSSPLVFDPVLPSNTVMPEGVSRVQSLHSAVAQADVVSFHCPPSEKPIFDADFLSHSRPGLIVVNTARSELVDSAVMLSALQTERVLSYAVDAFDSEPPVMSDVLSHPRVIATPHLGAFTEEAIERTLEITVRNLVDALLAPKNLEVVDLVSSLRSVLQNETPHNGLQIFWLGQAGFILRTGDGRTILIDPYLSDSLARKYEGTVFPHTRMMEPPISADAIPRVDLVLVSHAHTDHMDPDTLGAVARTHPRAVFVCPERVKDIAVKRGVPIERLAGATGGEILEPIPGIRIFPVPSAHEELDITDAGSAYLGYVIEVGGEKIYHSGDCVPYRELPGTLAAHSLTLALLPVNGRDSYRRKNGVPGNFTLPEALEICESAGIPTMIAHHWGMFDFNTLSPKQLDKAWHEYSGPTSWYIPDAKAFWERRPALVRDISPREMQI